MNKILFVIVLIACVMGSIAYQRKVTKDILDQLYALKKAGQKQAFFDLVNAPMTKLVFAKFNLELLKLNYELDLGTYEDAKKQFANFNGMRLNAQNMIALNLRMFHAALEAKDDSLACAIQEELIPVLQKQKDQKSQLILNEVIQLDRIYLKKDVTMIDELESALADCKDDMIKNLLCFRIAKLYHYLHDEERVDYYLKQALAYAPNEANKHSLQALINNHKGLD